MTHSATSGQIGRIEKILTANELYFNNWDRTWARLEAHRIDEREPGDGTRITWTMAQLMLDWLAAHGYTDPPRLHPGSFSRHCPACGFAHTSQDTACPRRRAPGCQHSADRNGNCRTCGAEMFDPSLAGGAR